MQLEGREGGALCAGPARGKSHVMRIGRRLAGGRVHRGVSAIGITGAQRGGRIVATSAFVAVIVGTAGGVDLAGERRCLKMLGRSARRVAVVRWGMGHACTFHG